MSLDVAARLLELVGREVKLETLIYLVLVFNPAEEGGYVHVSGERGLGYIPVYRVGGKPYIPPVGVYGVLRAIGERIAKQSLEVFADHVERGVAEAHCELEGDATRHTCSTKPEYIDSVVGLARQVIEGEMARHFIPIDSREEVLHQLNTALAKREPALIPRSIEPLLSLLCPICRTFGGAGLRSKIDIVYVEPHIEDLIARTRTSINRPTSTVHPKALYTEEQLSIHTLEVIITVRNIIPKSSEARILRALLEYLTSIGVSIGGRTSIGLGRLTLNARESRGVYIELSRIATVDNLLKSLIAPEQLQLQSIEQIIRILHHE